MVNYYLLSLSAHLSCCRFRRWRTGADRPHTRQQDVQGRGNTDTSPEETRGEKKRSEEESVCLLDWRGATFFSRGSPEGEWRFFSIPDRRGISYSVVAVRTTHITYTPWMMCGKKAYTLEVSEASYRIHNDRHVTTCNALHRIVLRIFERRLHAWSTDWSIDRSRWFARWRANG